eukprot:scaffold50045_cov57-Phaeocystis_antarctica.AAC.1
MSDARKIGMSGCAAPAAVRVAGVRGRARARVSVRAVRCACGGTRAAARGAVAEGRAAARGAVAEELVWRANITVALADARGARLEKV